MEIKYRLYSFIVLSLCCLSTQLLYAQKQGFNGYTFYHSEVQTHRLNKLPTVQVQKYEVVPPFTSDCQTIIINPGNGCRVKISSLVNSGIAQVSEITSPGNLESTVLGIEGLMMFDPNTGKINLLASTPGADAEEFKTASTTLQFTYNFKASHANHIVQFRDFYAETIGQIEGVGANVNIYLSSPSTGGVLWQVFETLRYPETKTVQDQKIDLFDFVREGDTVTLSVDVTLQAYSATVDIQEALTLGSLPAESGVSFRLTIPK
jgi:hypothetical protein